MRAYTALVALSALGLATAAPAPAQLPFLSSPPSPHFATTNSTPVHLQLAVMSRCPDAQLCEAVFDRVLEQRTDVQGDKVLVGELVDVELVFIARPNSTATYGVTCMHGDLECRGNIQELCAAKHWAEGEKGGRKEGEGSESGEEEGVEVMVGGLKGERGWEGWWNFLQCLNYGETGSIGTDAKAKECAKVVGRTWDGPVAACVDSHEGRDLLLASVKEAQKLEATKSCTMLLEGKQVCIHDGTWKSCPGGHEVGDFVRLIKDDFQRLNPPKKEEESEEDDEEEEWVMLQ
ncbi:hypothetical protein JCM10207_006231 [Rhodosporidiobolus poonsookiae]